MRAGLLALALLLVGCARPVPPPAERPSGAGAELAEDRAAAARWAGQLSDHERELDGWAEPGGAAPLAEGGCGPACDAAGAICDLAGRICAIADRHPGDAELAERCADATVRCRRARQRVAARACACALGPR